jgi:hypothetical protein
MPKYLKRYAQEGDEFLDSIMTGDETFPRVSCPKETSRCEKFDDYVEMQEKVTTWFKVQAADFYVSGI